MPLIQMELNNKSNKSNKSWDNLVDEASDIINSEYPTRKDMVRLSKIEFDMSVVASKASEVALQEEENYNFKRSSVVLDERWKKRSITEATEVWKYVAEKEHWCYRSMKEKAKWMWQIVASVRWFKISVYSSEKENDEMMWSNYTWLE